MHRINDRSRKWSLLSPPCSNTIWDLPASVTIVHYVPIALPKYWHNFDIYPPSTFITQLLPAIYYCKEQRYQLRQKRMLIGLERLRLLNRIKMDETAILCWRNLTWKGMFRENLNNRDEKVDEKGASTALRYYQRFCKPYWESLANKENLLHYL